MYTPIDDTTPSALSPEERRRWSQLADDQWLRKLTQEERSTLDDLTRKMRSAQQNRRT